VERIEDGIEDEILRNFLIDLIRETPGIFIDKESANFVKRHLELLIPILKIGGFVDDHRLEFYSPIGFTDRVKELIYRLILLGVNSSKKSYQEMAIELFFRFGGVIEEEYRDKIEKNARERFKEKDVEISERLVVLIFANRFGVEKVRRALESKNVEFRQAIDEFMSRLKCTEKPMELLDAFDALLMLGEDVIWNILKNQGSEFYRIISAIKDITPEFINIVENNPEDVRIAFSNSDYSLWWLSELLNSIKKLPNFVDIINGIKLTRVYKLHVIFRWSIEEIKKDLKSFLDGIKYLREFDDEDIEKSLRYPYGFVGTIQLFGRYPEFVRVIQLFRKRSDLVEFNKKLRMEAICASLNDDPKYMKYIREIVQNIQRDLQEEDFIKTLDSILREVGKEEIDFAFYISPRYSVEGINFFNILYILCLGKIAKYIDLAGLRVLRDWLRFREARKMLVKAPGTFINGMRYIEEVSDKEEITSAISRTFTGFVLMTQTVGINPSFINFAKIFGLLNASEFFENYMREPTFFDISKLDKYENIDTSTLSLEDLRYILLWELDDKFLKYTDLLSFKSILKSVPTRKLYKDIVIPEIEKFNADLSLMDEETRKRRNDAIVQLIRVLAIIESNEDIANYVLERDKKTGEYLFAKAIKRLISKGIEIDRIVTSIIKYGDIWDRFTADDKTLEIIGRNIDKFSWIVPVVRYLKDSKREKELEVLDKLIREEIKPVSDESIWSLNRVEFPVYLMDYLEYGEEATNLGYMYGQLTPYRVDKIREALGIGDEKTIERALKERIWGKTLVEIAKQEKSIDEVLRERKRVEEANNTIKKEFEEWLNSDRVPKEVSEVLERIKQMSEDGWEIGITSGTARNMLLVFLGKIDRYEDHDFDNVLRRISIPLKEFADRFENEEFKNVLLKIKEERIIIPSILDDLEDKIRRFEPEALEELHRRRREKINEYLGKYLPSDIIEKNIGEIEKVIREISNSIKIGDIRGETSAISRSDLGVNAIQIFYNSINKRFEVYDPDNSIVYAKNGIVKIYSGSDSIFDPERPRPVSAVEYSVAEIVLADAVRFVRTKALGDLRLDDEDSLVYSRALRQSFSMGLELPEFLRDSILKKLGANLDKLATDVAEKGKWNIEDTIKLVRTIAPYMNLSNLRMRLRAIIDKNLDDLPPVCKEYPNVEDIFTINKIYSFLQNRNYSREILKNFLENGEVPDNIALHGISLTKAETIRISAGENLPIIINLLGILEDKALKSGSMVREKYEVAVSTTQSFGEGIYIGRNLENPLRFAEEEGALVIINTKDLLNDFRNLEITDNSGDGKANLVIHDRKWNPIEIPLKYVEKIYVKPELYRYSRIYWQRAISNLSKEKGISYREAEQELNERTFGRGRKFSDVVECIYLGSFKIITDKVDGGRKLFKSEFLKILQNVSASLYIYISTKFKQEYPALERFLRKNRDYFRNLSTTGEKKLLDGGLTIKKSRNPFKEGISKLIRFLNGGGTKKTLVVLVSGNDKEVAFLYYLLFYFYLRIYWYFRGFSLKIIENATSQDLRRVLKDSSIRYIAVAGHGDWNGWRATDRYIDEDEIKEWVLQKDFYPKEMFITYTCGTPHTYSGEVKIEDKFGYHIVKNPLANLFGTKEVSLSDKPPSFLLF